MCRARPRTWRRTIRGIARCTCGTATATWAPRSCCQAAFRSGRCGGRRRRPMRCRRPSRRESRSSPTSDRSPRLMPSIGVSHAARRYNYLLGGKDHYAADRESGDALKSIFPAVEPAAWENRSFMRRVVHHLAAEYGTRQFIDVGVGLPFAPNVHEVAQTIHPDARVVYVDNDPIVAVHARALLAGTRPGVRVFVGGDVRDPEAITADPLLRGTLDLARPVAVLLFAVLHYVPDDDVVAHALHPLAAACAPGSFLAMSHV